MISTMLSGTAGTSLRESRRPPARAPWPGSPHPAGSLRIRTLSSVPRRRPGKAQPRWPGTSARQRHPPRPATWPGPPQDQASVMSWPPANRLWGRAPAGETAATVIPRGSARTAGIPAGDAASIRAAIPAGPPSPQVACRRSDTDPPTDIRPQPPPPRLEPRRRNAERDDDDNAVRALTTPTGIRTPGPALQAETPGSSPRPPVIGITCLDCCRFGTPDDPGHQAASRTPGPATRPAASRYRAVT